MSYLELNNNHIIPLVNNLSKPQGASASSNFLDPRQGCKQATRILYFDFVFIIFNIF